MSRIPASVAFGAAALIATMATAAAAVEAPTRPAALEGVAIAWCGDVPTAQADRSAYRDKPVYVWGNPDVPKVQK